MRGYTAKYKIKKNIFYEAAGRLFFVFNIPTALKGWVGHAPQGRGALHHKKNLILMFLIPIAITYIFLLTVNNSQI